MDLKGTNIRVNVVSPGTVVTPAYKSELGMNDEQIGGGHGTSRRQHSFGPHGHRR
jgi:NAD(P)-dependent dehydrogenase (short-subunit alcohol dehydrogenase family)